MAELPKTFDPAAIEARWYAHWEGEGRFRPARPEAEPWTIVIPPPNVTGSLHIGHALDVTLQDILTRHARLEGKDALWVVGTDHAGIATQMVVERNLASQDIKRADMSREQFVEHVWEWKAQSGGAITRQLRRLGASCDWSREQFTMDPHFSRAVTKVFVDLYNQGLLYRDKRLVNWDPHFRTAISDLEVDTREVQGKFWHFRYPLADGSGHISVATTRPETMLADMAVAVHPDDERYKALVGKQVRLPITGRLVPIVADEHADPALGSGAVKITPGHDFNDFEVGVRAGIKPADMLNMLDAGAAVTQTADGLIPADLIGLDRFAARERVVALLDAEGLLDKVEDRLIATPFGDRSDAAIEPWLTDQWYVDAKTLAEPAIEAVRSGAIRVVPETWKKTYLNWLENIQPWCVSRQLWWGHRIPAWHTSEYKREGNDLIHVGTPGIYVAEDAARAEKLAEADANGRTVVSYDTWDDAVKAMHLGLPSVGDPENVLVLLRDHDVLDTWFSSALWPFGTLGWPEDKSSAVPSEVEERSTDRVEEGPSTSLGTARSLVSNSRVPDPYRQRQESLLARHYPNDVLISGFDILFFWDARMIMQGLRFMGEVPFRTLYLHGLVRDAQGQKMSKSKGNTVDPLGLIDRYGADALRFTLAAMESQGRDIKLDEKRVEGYRNFATKLWNAARFCQANGIGASATLEPPPAALPVNCWIVARTIETIQTLDLALADLRFDEAANTIYHFVWDRFCDWYVELIKGEIGKETRAVAGWVLDQILVMLHPFMPFVTEELWHASGERPYDLILAKWPMADARAIDREAVEEIEWLIGLVSAIRTARTEMNVPPSARLPIYVLADAARAGAKLEANRGALGRLARVEPVDSREVGDGQGIVVETGGTSFRIHLGNVVDFTAERARLNKSIEAATKERDALAVRLANPGFVEKAKPEAVAKARADHAERASEAERLAAALARLG